MVQTQKWPYVCWPTDNLSPIHVIRQLFPCTARPTLLGHLVSNNFSGKWHIPLMWLWLGKVRLAEKKLAQRESDNCQKNLYPMIFVPLASSPESIDMSMLPSRWTWAVLRDGFSGTSCSEWSLAQSSVGQGLPRITNKFPCHQESHIVVRNRFVLSPGSLAVAWFFWRSFVNALGGLFDSGAWRI